MATRLGFINPRVGYVSTSCKTAKTCVFWTGIPRLSLSIPSISSPTRDLFPLEPRRLASSCWVGSRLGYRTYNHDDDALAPFPPTT